MHTIVPLNLNVGSSDQTIESWKSSLSSCRNHSQNCSCLSGSSSFIAWKVSECKAFIFELAKFDEHWISRYQSYENIASMTYLGIVQKPAWLHQHSHYQWNFSFFCIDPSAHLCTVPSTLNLSRILVIVTIVGGGVPNSTLQRRWTSTTFSIFQ